MEARYHEKQMRIELIVIKRSELILNAFRHENQQTGLVYSAA